jgi:branched-chain amino acid transport system substrate-binding protein
MVYQVFKNHSKEKEVFKMKKVFKILVLILALSWVVFGGPSYLSAAEKGPVKIGFNLGLTSFMALSNKPIVQAVTTTLDLAGWEVAGRKIEKVLEDNASSPTVAVDKARKMVEGDKVDVIIGPMFTPAAYAVVDYLVKSDGPPHISIIGQGKRALQIGGKLMFIPYGMTSIVGYTLGSYAADTLGYKTANLMYLEDDQGVNMTNGTRKAFEERGGSIVKTQSAPIETLDFSSYLMAMKPADCTFFWIFGAPAITFVKQYREYGLKMPLMITPAVLLQEPMMKALGDKSLDIHGVDYYVPMIDNELNKKFVDAYVKQWKEYPNSISFAGKLAVDFFLEAVKSTKGDTSPKAIKNALKKVKVKSIAGEYSFSEEKNAYIGIGNMYITKSIKIGDRYTWEVIKTYDQMRFEDRQ